MDVFGGQKKHELSASSLGHANLGMSQDAGMPNLLVSTMVKNPHPCDDSLMKLWEDSGWMVFQSWLISS